MRQLIAVGIVLAYTLIDAGSRTATKRRAYVDRVGQDPTRIAAETLASGASVSTSKRFMEVRV
jgi:hypothetical protein